MSDVRTGTGPVPRSDGERSLFDDADEVAGTLSLRVLRPAEAEDAVNAILAASAEGRRLQEQLRRYRSHFGALPDYSNWGRIS